MVTGSAWWRGGELKSRGIHSVEGFDPQICGGGGNKSTCSRLPAGNGNDGNEMMACVWVHVHAPSCQFQPQTWSKATLSQNKQKQERLIHIYNSDKTRIKE